MNKALFVIGTLVLGSAATSAHAGAPRGGPYAGAHHSGGYRPYHPAVRPVYPGWRAGYWAPRAGIYIGTPLYAGWPYGWGASYAWPYAVAPLVVNAAPAPQIIVQPAPAAPAPADSYWYYCTQPAGYFPYVQQCGQPWMKVVPQLPGGQTPPQLAP